MAAAAVSYCIFKYLVELITSLPTRVHEASHVQLPVNLSGWQIKFSSHFHNIQYFYLPYTLQLVVVLVVHTLYTSTLYKVYMYR